MFIKNNKHNLIPAPSELFQFRGGLINMLWQRQGILSLLLFLCIAASAQNKTDDPVIMRVAGKPVLRSEFEYSYNKNNAEGVIDKKSVAEYVPLFIAYKLKVQAALDAHLDTLSSFRNEFATYRDQQIRPAFINDADVEAYAHKIYTDAEKRIDGNGGMVKVAHILLLVPRSATAEQEKATKAKIDSIYKVLEKGGDFAELAKKYSEDPGSAKDGGEMPWIVKGQTLKEFEDAAWALKNGEISKPVRTAAGWHIILKEGSQKFYDYDSQRKDILAFIDSRGLREQIINEKLDTLAKQQNTTVDKLLAAKREEMEAKDSNLKYLIKEYHDGLLLFEIANRMVWNKAQEDSVGQEAYFKKHRSEYKWAEPRFKGIAYCTRHQEDVQKVKETLRGVPFDEWAEVLRKTFNNDSILRIRAEKGVFKEGMNALVDKEIFGKDTTATAIKDYPYTSIYGRKINAPEEVDDVRQQIITDYQNSLEKQWVEALKKRYKVSVDDKVLATVNKH